MTTHADEFQALSDTLYHWSVYDPSVKCEIGCTALKLASGWVVVDPVPLAEAAWKELLALAPDPGSAGASRRPSLPARTRATGLIP